MTTESFDILTLIATCKKISRSRAGVYAMLDARHPSYDPTFPRPIKIGSRRIGFVEHELDAWIVERMQARDLAATTGAVAC
ncbi:helix-turn-helix transcriptional regulator [Chitinimonas sp. JJ19]|uniref:helix-turn-helix transcriptional regulator n=1 Tax=Chitinimonas sp. JJ19 TaxID=3109352 RepID=UPI003FA59FA5